MNQQQMQIFIKMNSITGLNRIANILYRVFSLCILSTTILFGQSNLFNSGRNNRPVADAGPDIKVQSTSSILLDASRSFINDGSKLKFEWIFAPGLVYNNENEFTSELSVKPYDSTYLKSIQTYKQLLDITIADNDLGTRLEVILKVKDRIGFEDTDTLIIEYFDSSVLDDTLIDSVQLSMDLFDLEVSVLDSEMFSQSSSGILIQGLVQDEITPADIQIVNSIIADQIQTLGFDYEFYLNKDLHADDLLQGYRFDCISDSCAAMNAKIINASYVISWSFDGANGSISMRIFDPKNYNEWIDTKSISNPLSSISESGIYSLDPSLRTAVSNILDGKIFRKKISRIDRFKMKSKPLLRLGKYPLMLGAVYLLIDKVFLQESEEPPIKPPRFPHAS
ncbi:MAG: hypothetical protein HN815_04290 [Candidatus Marinimicrobia bacterium]|nr:hypothetical protein [Candidatus Neomarinimicrobiota bacterium]MBT7373190.1 hypothetical protein [Candidatus Neomarinimicrobiota bacterium]